jgi:hypothetical protein
MGLPVLESKGENRLYSKDIFDKGAVRTYDARLC